MSATATIETPTVTRAASRPNTLRKPGPHKPQAKARKDGRLTGDGLVRIGNADALDAVPLYYNNNKWFARNGAESFGYYPDGNAKTLLAEYGFNRSIKDEHGNTPADRATLWLMQNHSVAYAGPLAGYRAGLHEYDGKRILVTESPRIIEPKSGKFPTIRMLIESLLADAVHPQRDIFYTWLAESFAAFYQRMTSAGPWPFRYAPALAIFGPRMCGKTAAIDLVISPLFGGRKGDPMTFMREKRFNKDLFAASLLVLDDKGASSNLTERRERGESLKDLIWKQEQRMEGKGADAIMLPPFWRMVMAGNDDDSGLQSCPALSPSLEDKIIILRAQQAEGLPETHEDNEAWVNIIRKELPAFAAFLLTYRPPPEMVLDKRTRVVSFWHPSIVASLRDMQPEMKLLELIDALRLIPDSQLFWEGTATEFERQLRSLDKESITDRLFGTTQAAGRMLSELARVCPDRVERTNRGNTSHYRIKLKPESGEVTQG